jgi:hypothetical protein
MTGVEYLQTLHTKQLMNMRNEYSKALICHNLLGCIVNGHLIPITYDELKQVLSERPHIPRRSETKRIRQVAAKSKVRAHSTRCQLLNL